MIYPTIIDKVAVITGGAKGIGRALARRFSAMGYSVAISYKNSANEATEFLEEASKAGWKAIAVRADLQSYDDAKKLRDKVIATFGKIDVLVNNAGSASYKLLASMTEEDIENMLADNLKSCIFTTKAFYDDFAFAKNGSIINVSSVWGIKGASMETIYSAAKAGIIGFTKAMAKELAPCNVRVNAIAPGVIKTDMLKNFSEEELADVAKDIPCGRIGLPEDVSGTAIFLASNASSYITGEVINVSGGYVI
ncbi:MAG: glucose 1-dehydrogenase [Clostridia bacterium]|nr:glucose 1-dehydrogenase [Clostridia bacterium]